MIKLTLVQGDCLKYLPKISNESIDLVITDPPYNISEGTVPIYDTCYKERGHKESRKVQLNAEWDKFTDEEFLEIMYRFFDESYRILKPSGTLICFTSDRYLSYFRTYVRSLGMVYRQTCVWIKSNPVPQMRKVKFMHSTELFFFANKERGHDSFRWENGQRPNVFYHPIVAGRDRLDHPTQKPVWLFKELIKYFTREKDLVLDPFVGSGTTLEACRALNRNCIGIEISPEYIKLCKKRLNWGSTLGDVEFKYEVVS
jgi:DNA modification methylase